MDTFKISYLIITLVLCFNATSGQTSEEIFNFNRTVQVTPDTNFLTGALGYIHYLPSRDCFIVMLSSELEHSIGGFEGKCTAFKEYTTDMQETGHFGVIGVSPGDMTTRMVDSTLFMVSMATREDTIGWELSKYDAITWMLMKKIFVPLLFPVEQDGGPTIALLGNKLDITGEYLIDSLLDDTRASHHHFFTKNLMPLGTKYITDTSHTPEVSIVDMDSVYYMLASTTFFGDLFMMQYDTLWKFLGAKNLGVPGRFPTGVAYDDHRFYIDYLAVPYPNIRLAAYDYDWNLLEDIAVTNYSESDNLKPDSPYLLMHDDRLFVSYVIDSLDPVTHIEKRKWQAYVSIYDVNQSFTGLSPETTYQNGDYLMQNYPNPFSTSTTISYQILNKSHIALKVMDMSGRVIATIVDGIEEPGYKSVSFNGNGLANGVYYYCIRAGSYFDTKKLIIISQ